MNKEKIEFIFKKIKLILNYFFCIIGIIVFCFFLIEFLGHIIYKEDFKEQLIDYKYHPYLDFISEMRKTDNPCFDSNKDYLLIYMYGGSTMWGVSANDDETIPSYLSNILCSQSINVKIVNFGMLSHISTQEMIKLVLQLRDGQRPDIVIFYDGVNDIASTIPDYPYDITYNLFKELKKNNFLKTTSNIFENLEFNSNNYFDFFFNNYYGNLYNNYDEKMIVNESLKFYLNNVKFIKSLENNYNFKSFNYWQPNLVTKKKISEDEFEIFKLNKYNFYLDRYNLSKKILLEINLTNKNIIDLSNIFDNYSDTIYIDDCHKFPIGNKIIAQRMANDIIKYLND
ncbi:MAG: hypothetical protein ACLFPJ_06120, partial [Candidatus Woesearchaeota archaeon]